MARVDAFLYAESDKRTLSLGGRSSNRSIDARINTDNATKSDCQVRVYASVKGDKELYGKPRKTCHCCGHRWEQGVVRTVFNTESHKQEFRLDVEDAKTIQFGDSCPNCRNLRQGQDQRVSTFYISTPKTDEACRVFINNQPLSELVHLTDDEIVNQIKRRGLYNRVVTELFGKNPLLDNIQEPEVA
jgi:hypothetical protein